MQQENQNKNNQIERVITPYLLGMMEGKIKFNKSTKRYESLAYFATDHDGTRKNPKLAKSGFAFGLTELDVKNNPLALKALKKIVLQAEIFYAKDAKILMQIKTISDKAIAGMQTTQSERDFFNLNVFTLPEVRKTIDQADAVRIGQVETKIRIFNRDLADLLNKEPLKEFNKFRGHNTYKFRGHQIPGTPNSGDTILNCPTRTSPRNSQVSCP